VKPPPPLPAAERMIIAAASIELATVPASLKNYSRTVRHPTLIALHATDGHEGLNKDRDVARMFQDPALSPKRSCQWVCDSNSATLCVGEQFTAWHCGPRGNRLAIGVELCGRANQTRAQWLDELSHPMLCIAARLVADRCHVWGIPPRLVGVDELRATSKPTGITTHALISEAWRESNHTDPGPHFPLTEFITAVAEAVALMAPPLPSM